MKYYQVYVLVMDILKANELIEVNQDEFGQLIHDLKITDISMEFSNRVMYFVTSTAEDREKAIEVLNKKYGKGTAWKYKGNCGYDHNYRLVRDIPKKYLAKRNEDDDFYLS